MWLASSILSAARRCPAWQAAVLLFCLAGASLAEESQPLRVCADPDDLPSSNRERQGFENKIAELVAQELGTSLSFYWWPYQRGLVRNTLKADQCDILISVPKDYDPVLVTKAYYRSAYVLIYRSDRKLGLHSLDDPALKQLKIGAQINMPPYDALGNRGLMANVTSYNTFFDPQDPDPASRPQKIIQDVVAGTIDVALAWGPLAGYFVKQHPSPSLEVVPLDDEGSLPMSFEFSMGVKQGNRELKARLEGILDRRQADIRKILEDYGIPLLPLKPPGEPVEGKHAQAGSHQHDPENN